MLLAAITFKAILKAIAITALVLFIMFVLFVAFVCFMALVTNEDNKLLTFKDEDTTEINHNI